VRGITDDSFTDALALGGFFPGYILSSIRSTLSESTTPLVALGVTAAGEGFFGLGLATWGGCAGSHGSFGGSFDADGAAAGAFGASLAFDIAFSASGTCA
jgi:hypothetical protein